MLTTRCTAHSQNKNYLQILFPILVDSSVQEKNNTKATFSKLGSYEASKNYRNSQIYSLSEISSRQTHNLLHFLEEGEGKSKNS